MRRKVRPSGGKQIEYVIESLGARGDGVASYDGQPLFTAMTLPGERVRGRIKGTRTVGFKADLLELLSESPARQDPLCPHFGPCGGCVLQHAKPDFYRNWKRDLVVQALKRQGFDADQCLEPLVEIGSHTRRRATFVARLQNGKVAFGFHARESHDVIDVTSCALLRPELMPLIAPLRALLAVLLDSALGKTADVAVTLCAAGADIVLVGRLRLNLKEREAMSTFARDNAVARMAWIDADHSSARGAQDTDPELLFMRENPVQFFGSVPVTPPAGSFLQPSEEGEKALVSLVLAALPLESCAEPKNPEHANLMIADLFCGCGTFTFALAQRGRVHAIEGNRAAVVALASSARRFSARVTTDWRDLAKSPVAAEDFDGGDVVVLNPPRSGAREQCRQLALSTVPVVIYVSCNPNAFARDARILADGGYRLERVTAVDQFIWSGHVELVARFVQVSTSQNP